MKMRAVKTFSNRRLGLVRAGAEIVVNSETGRQLRQTGLAVLLEESADLEAPEKAAVPAAPETAEHPSSAGGKDLLSSALPPARASRRATVRSSGRGARSKKTDG